MIGRFRRALLRLFRAEPRDVEPALTEIRRFIGGMQRLAATAETGREAGR